MDVSLMQKTDQLAAELAQNVTTLEELNTEMDVHPRRRLIPALRRSLYHTSFGVEIFL